MNYSTYTTALSSTMAVSATNADFVAIEPSIIDYAENRCYRDLDLLNTRTTDSSSSLGPNVRSFSLPTTNGRFVVVDGVNLVESSVRTPLVPATLDYIDFAWGSSTAAATTTRPAYFAMLTDQTIIVGPPSGASVTIEVIGTIRPTALSASNTTTFLSLYLPDLFLAASMVFASGWQKNFGAQGDDPRQAVSWESQYQALLQSANNEETRKRYAAASWSSKRVEATAQPQRG